MRLRKRNSFGTSSTKENVRCNTEIGKQVILLVKIQPCFPCVYAPMDILSDFPVLKFKISPIIVLLLDNMCLFTMLNEMLSKLAFFQ